MTPPVKARSGHLILDGRKTYKDLAKVYPEIHRRLVDQNRPLPKESDPILPEVILEENLRDLRADRKPVGYNRQDPSGLRLVFPIREDRRLEFYVTKPIRCQEVVSLTESISSILRKAGLKHVVEYDRWPLTPPRPGAMPTSGLSEESLGGSA